MSETKPTAEQVRFESDKTGSHVLKEYLEACERGSMTLSGLLDILFDEDGLFQTDFLQFRIKDAGGGDYTFQTRAGTFLDPEDGWVDISEDIFTTIVTACADAQAASEAARDLCNGYVITAQAAASAAVAAQTATATLLDNFDDRYLGTKSSDPTLDNDGNALVDGALYFNTTSNTMRVYDTGTTTWIAIDIDAKNFKVSNNDSTPGFLEDKLLVSANSFLALSTQNDGANETRTITASIAAAPSATPAINDMLLIGDVSASDLLKRTTIATVLALLLAQTNTFSGAQIASETALTSTSNSIAINMALNNDFTHTFTENTTLANPSNATVGQSGAIRFTQHASSPKTLAFGTSYKFAGGTVPTVTATNSAADTLYYYVRSPTFIECNMAKAYA